MRDMIPEFGQVEKLIDSAALAVGSSSAIFACGAAPGEALSLHKMILCITPNPAIDRTLILPSLALGQVHRAERIIVAAGGKGLNVARTIQRLGGEPFCIGFAGGHSGRLLSELAQKEGLPASWTSVDSETRSSTILIAPESDATLINELGPPVTGADWARLREDVRRFLPSASLVTISGSLPPGTSADDLQEFLQLLLGAGKSIWVDTSGATLDTVLNCPGLCVKVNGAEIGACLGFEVNDVPAAKRVLTMLGDRGLAARAITLGSAGAIVATEEGRWYVRGPRVRVVSSVASGDAFLGGLVYARERGKDWPESLQDAVAAGTANTLSAGGGRFTLEDFHALRERIQIEAW